MSTKFLTPERRRFIDDLAAMLATWALPLASGRIYAYLLLCSEPASLDDIAEDLELSKSTASVTARQLEKHGMAVRYGVPGTKRALYGPPVNPTGLILEKVRLLEGMAKLMQGSAATVAADAAAERLVDLAQYYLAMRDAIASAVHKVEAELV